MKSNLRKQEIAGHENSDTKNYKIMHWISMLLCSSLYIVLIYLLFRINKDTGYVNISLFGYSIEKGMAKGVTSQLMVMDSVLLVLNPLKKSKMAAVVFATFVALSAIRAIVIEGNLNALPGIVIPVSSVIIVVIISRFERNLNNQIKKVMTYNKIMRENDEQLQHMAYYDSLTELPNRKMMMDQMEALTDSSLPYKNKFTFAFLDLDNFKKINDRMGHSVGDYILTQVAKRWSERVHSEDLLGRVGGDEFALLISRDLPMVELLDYLEGFQSVLKEAIMGDDKEFYVSASFGITMYPKDGENTAELMRNADIALYKAKNAGKNEYCFFVKDMQDEIYERFQLENCLLSSIKNNELFMVYEAQYVCGTKTLRGYEALARWKCPEIGLVSPCQFIPIAEDSGFIIDMGQWIITTVLKKFKDLQNKSNIIPIVSINISVIQMLEPSFVAMVKEIIEETGFDSRYLEFEITESVFISYPEYIIEVIKQLRELGIRIALDDFGTGYASLSYLQMLPINVLKIDKSFISKISTHSETNRILDNIISLSHQLDIEVVAEGVELGVQLEYLVEHNCDYVQGYLIGKPIEEKELKAKKIEKMMMPVGATQELKASGM